MIDCEIVGRFAAAPIAGAMSRTALRMTWYGYAAFLVETNGLRVILDPFRSPDSGDYEPIAEPADLVVVSHENDHCHSHRGQIVGPLEVIHALELPGWGGRPRHPFVFLKHAR
jgi:hypothetical protein